MSVSSNETIKKLDEKIAQLQAQKKTIENREKAKAKKERTRRLIKFGELVEKYLNPRNPDELEVYLKANVQPKT